MDEIKLHLGCSDRYLPGYIHVDIDNKPHIDYPNVDVRNLKIFPDDSVDVIYNCGIFEYFDREEVPEILKEWRRVLKVGGVLRISVPDFESIIEVYSQNGKDLDGEGILGPLYGRWGVTLPNNTRTFLYHKTVYDYISLSKVLSCAKFINIHRYDCWEIMPEDYDDFSKAYIPYKDKSGIQIHLNVECRKGPND
jgi:predicted SAM-dependent methyltransferase